jgi:hypothetical protein
VKLLGIREIAQIANVSKDLAGLVYVEGLQMPRSAARDISLANGIFVLVCFVFQDDFGLTHHGSSPGFAGEAVEV